MRIRAFIPAYNEVDILPWALAHLLNQGVEPYVLDGWSTDGTWEALEGFGRERFPADGPAKEQCCSAILERIENLAAQSDADWIIYTDADEIRRSDRYRETLAQGIARCDADGCNVIDHKVYVFVPVDDGWTADKNPETYLRYCTAWEEMLCRIPQKKTWKNVGPVKLGGGGHIVEFPGKKVWPEKFILKHYPYRTNAQAREKIRVRIERRCHEEHRAGWGVHYDSLTPQSNFIRDPTIGTLAFWRDPEYPRP